MGSRQLRNAGKRRALVVGGSMSGLFGAQNQAVAPQEAMIQNQLQQQQMQQQLMMQLFGQQQNQYNQGQQQQSQNLAGLGSLVGTGLGLFL